MPGHSLKSLKGWPGAKLGQHYWRGAHRDWPVSQKKTGQCKKKSLAHAKPFVEEFKELTSCKVDHAIDRIVLRMGLARGDWPVGHKNAKRCKKESSPCQAIHRRVQKIGLVQSRPRHSSNSFENGPGPWGLAG